MAAADVEVTFAASIEKLLAGINGGTAAIQGFAKQVEEVTGSVGKVAAALGEAFAVEKIIEFVSRMAELGEQTERLSAMLGLSTTEVQQLGFIAKITGTDAEGLALSMERLQVNLQKAQAGTGPAAQALEALKIPVKDLIGLPLPEQMNRIADAVSKFADGGNKTAIVMELLGRSGAAMIPILDKGRAGLEELRDAAETAGTIMTRETVEALVSVQHGAVTLGAALTTLSATIVGTFAAAINAGTKGVVEFVADLTALVATGHFGEAAMIELAGAFKILAANLANTAVVFDDLIHFHLKKAIDDWKAGAAEMTAISSKMDSDIAATVAKAQQEMKALLSAGEGSTLPQAPSSGAPNKDAVGAAMKQVEGEVAVLREGLAQKKLIYDAEAAQFQITQDRKFALLQTAVQQESAEEEKLLQSELRIGNLTVAERQSVENKIKELHAKTSTELVRLDEQSIAEQQKAWLGYINTVTGAFNSQIKGLLQGTLTWSQAMKNMLLDLTVKFIEMVEKWAAEWIAGQLGMTTATTTGAAARAAAETAAQTATLPERAGKFVSDITANAALAFAGIFANLAPLLGPAAAGPAAAGQATVMAELANVPKLDVGGFVLSSGLAMIHKGETVTPASTSPLQGGRSGGDMHVHLNAIDTQSGYQFLMANMSSLARELKAHMDRNPSHA